MPKVPPYILYAIPVFFLLIGVELLVARIMKRDIYRLNDAITNLSCGVASQVMGLLVRGSLIVAYLYLHEHYRFFSLGADRWWVWVACFVGVDFFYYWFHRYAHEISFMWGGHIVHHQSEEYNLSVALRQGSFQGFTGWVFYLPLALIGFDPYVFLIVGQFQTLYQFWIHTRLIDKMWAPFEYIFNTPSHHRVHHGVNPKYIDKNHGGTLIIWDRMFGTFQAEEEEVVYGVTKPLASWNPIWANFDYLLDMARLIVRCRNPLDMLRVLVKGPGWRPQYLGGPQTPQPITVQQFHKYDVQIPAGLGNYVLAQYVVVILGASAYLALAGELRKAYDGWQEAAWIFGLAALVLLAIATMGGLLAGKTWSPTVEVVRLGLMVASGTILAWHAPLFWLPLAIGGAWMLASMLWLGRFWGAIGANAMNVASS
jgi:alkylglycerol monooxygenase